MSNSERRSFGSLLTQFSATIVMLLLVSAPALSWAEPLLLLHSDVQLPPLPAAAVQDAQRSVTVGLNENGDLIVRHRGLSLVVAYNPPNDIIDPMERIRIAQRQECPAISGISLKVSLLF